MRNLRGLLTVYRFPISLRSHPLHVQRGNNRHGIHSCTGVILVPLRLILIPQCVNLNHELRRPKTKVPELVCRPFLPPPTNDDQLTDWDAPSLFRAPRFARKPSTQHNSHNQWIPIPILAHNVPRAYSVGWRIKSPIYKRIK